MAYAFRSEGVLDYLPCRYGSSKLVFRGPGGDVSGDYVAVLGGTETYGKYVPRPYPALMQGLSGIKTVNLGCINAGPDAYLNDPGVIELAARARIAVVQVMGAQNLTNRLYTVHPRRNDRFLRASPGLQAMFPQVDFTEFHFTRHMLSTLKDSSAAAFEVVAAELRTAWTARMKSLLSHLPEVVLLWMAGHAPPPPGGPADLSRDPMLVDSAMLAAIRPLASAWVEVVDTAPAEGLVYGPMELAPTVPGPLTHQAAAEALAGAVARLL